MEEAFEKLKKEGKNDVDHLVQWMKDSKIIDEAKASEEKAKALFKDVANKHKVDFESFKEALAKLAAEQGKTLDELSKNLTVKSQKFASAFSAAANAFREAMKK